MFYKKTMFDIWTLKSKVHSFIRYQAQSSVVQSWYLLTLDLNVIEVQKQLRVGWIVCKNVRSKNWSKIILKMKDKKMVKN